MILMSSLKSTFESNLLKEENLHGVYTNLRAIELKYYGAVDKDESPMENIAEVIENVGKALVATARMCVERTLQLFKEEGPTEDPIQKI
jgi:hypothetical protein